MDLSKVTQLFGGCWRAILACANAVRFVVVQALHNQFAVCLNMVRRWLRNRRLREIRRQVRRFRNQQRQAPIQRHRHPQAPRTPCQLLLYRLQLQRFYQEEKNLQRHLTHGRIQNRHLLPCACNFEEQDEEQRLVERVLNAETLQQDLDVAYAMILSNTDEEDEEEVQRVTLLLEELVGNAETLQQDHDLENAMILSNTDEEDEEEVQRVTLL